jgi:hypothetical protein
MVLKAFLQKTTASSTESPIPCEARWAISGPPSTVERERIEANLEEQVVLLTPFVLEMLAAAQSVLERAHAHGEALPREVWHHLGGNLLAIAGGREDILGGDAGLEAHGEMLEDGKKTLILVETRKGLGGHLQR